MSLATTIAREAINNRESITVVMRRHGVDPFGWMRSKVARELERLREEEKPKPSEMRRRAMERQLQINGPVTWGSDR